MPSRLIASGVFLAVVTTTACTLPPAAEHVDATATSASAPVAELAAAPPTAQPGVEPAAVAAEPPAVPPWIHRGPGLGYLPPATVQAPLSHDIWDRIRLGFAIEAEAARHDRVDRELDWFLRHPEYLARVVARAEPFLHFIVETLEQEGVPLDIALLPIVESAFQPFAYSHGRAAGIWQFIPSTGRLYGLKQNWWYDGRRDIAASTRAAARHLRDLGEAFDGDWLKALAAYNAGAGNVRRAVRKNEKRQRPTDFWSLDLPWETRGYVPKLLALRRLVAAPALYGLELQSIADEPRLAFVDAGGQIDLALAAELAEIELEELYMHNPGYNRWATDPQGPHELLLPAEAAVRLGERLEGYAADQRVTWRRHRVASGETLSQIARRYRTTVEQLQEVNSLRSHVIRAGHHLLIPVASRRPSQYSLSAGQRLKAIQSRSHAGHKHTHVVLDGETLWEISRRYGVTTRSLAGWNGMAPRDLIHPGQELVVWRKPAAETDSGVRRVAFAADLSEHAIRTVRYRVRRGDSLAAIARKFNVTVAQLRRWNEATARSKYLQPGQVLRIRVDVRRQSG